MLQKPKEEKENKVNSERFGMNGFSNIFQRNKTKK